jgi:hypothetical protein
MSGDDRLFGDAGDDSLHGDSFTDAGAIDCGTGNDGCVGGTGSDTARQVRVRHRRSVACAAVRLTSGGPPIWRAALALGLFYCWGVLG